MFYKVLYVNPKNNYDREVRYFKSLDDAMANTPASKVISAVSLAPYVPDSFVLYENVRAELFL